jgi:hypothetical protein
MSEIYVTGGELRQSVFRKVPEWQSCKKGMILRLDLETKKSDRCVEYVSPPEVCAEGTAGGLFKSASVVGNKLYACTSTEVLVYQLPDFQLVHYVSLPCFNDLHHVCPTGAGTLLVAVTGLDMVVEVTKDGSVRREWSVVGQDTWRRFSRDVDYRRVRTTKPHQSHPNHVFEIRGEVWVTRFDQRDAISLTDPGKRIDISIERPHDGYLFGDHLYFTTVDGHIVLVRKTTLRVEKVYDLNSMGGPAGQVLGWCRGLLPLSHRFLWVGFTRVRPTKFRENLAWMKSGSGYARQHRATHLALYDLEQGKCVDQIPLEPHGIGVVFSLLPLPPGA